MQRFAVDAVEPAKEPLPTQPLRSRTPDALAMGGDPECAVVDHAGVHPLLAAVSLAFAQHRPLVLSPDAVWLTIAQGVAQHVRLNAERLRPRLVRHDGKQKLEIRVDAVPTTDDAWAAAIGAFRDALGAELGEGRARLFDCDFSTSTDTELVASRVVLMDVYAPYFSYWMTAVCGIPTITVTGTVADWQAIRARVEVLAELDLERWARSLRPILDVFVRAAGGDVDVAFWKRIYNPQDAYGGEIITGWITRFYPYLRDKTLDHPNPMLELAIDEPKDIPRDKAERFGGMGVSSRSVPATVSRVDVRVVDQVRRRFQRIELVAGVVAVAQDPDGGLRPIAGWHVEQAELRIGELLDRLERDHDTVPASTERKFSMGGTADMLAFDARFARATLRGKPKLTIFGGDDRAYVRGTSGTFSTAIIAQFPDGRAIAIASNHRLGKDFCLIGRAKIVPREAGQLGIRPASATFTGPPMELVGSYVSVIDAIMTAPDAVDSLKTGRTLDDLLSAERRGEL